MSVRYERDVQPGAEEVAELYRRAGLRRPTEDLPRMERMIQNSNLIIAGRDGERLVGIARSLADFGFSCYLSDLAVDPEYQGLHIGRELIRLTKEAAGEGSMLLLLSAPGAMTYYPHVGFEPVQNAWIIHREG